MEAAYVCLPNLLAGGLPAGALPGLALAADKRAQHTRATQKSTTHARHTKRDAWIYTGDITAAIAMRGRRGAACGAKRSMPRCAAPAPLSLLSYLLPCMRPCISFCVARVCCALLCGARVLCSFVSCKRQTCRQAPSQEIRQA